MADRNPFTESREHAEAVRALADFGARVLRESRDELADLDGGFLQEAGVASGVLMPVQATEPCGEVCRCQEYDDFPQTCYRYPAAVQRVLQDKESAA